MWSTKWQKPGKWLNALWTALAFGTERSFALLSHLLSCLFFTGTTTITSTISIPFEFCKTVIIRISPASLNEPLLFLSLSFSELWFYRKTSTSWWSRPAAKETPRTYCSSKPRRRQLPVGRGADSKKWLVSGINNECLLQLQARPPSVSRILTGGGTGLCCSRWTIRDRHSWEFVPCFGFFAMNVTNT